MDKQDLQKFIGSENMTVSEVMQKIDLNTNGILFFLDGNNRLKGCTTDGDIRRFLLSGGKISDVATNAINNKPKFAHSFAEAKEIFHNRDFVVIPIVDRNCILVDLYFGENIDNKKKCSSLNIPVVINAGGKGTRLDPYTRVLPKPLIPVGDIPIIEHIMKEYQSYNCCEFHIIVNYKKELMKAYFADSDNKYHVSWYDEDKALGTGGGLKLLRGRLNGTFFFANCDTLLIANYGDILKFHKDNRNVITMVCAYKNINIPYGVVEMGVNGSIKEMKEKPLISFLTNTGIYIVEPEVINDIEDNEEIGFPDIVEREKQNGKRVAVFPVSENCWMDMGQIPELEKMRIRLYGE